jgi:hypothetical protein
MGHRDLRMTKRYARIASAQVRQAVNGLDSMLPEGKIDEMGRANLPSTAQNLPEGDTANAPQ